MTEVNKAEANMSNGKGIELSKRDRMNIAWRREFMQATGTMNGCTMWALPSKWHPSSANYTKQKKNEAQS